MCLPRPPIEHLGRQERRTPPRPPRAPAIACACSPVMSWHHVHARQPAQQLATHRALTCSCCFTGALPGIMMGRTGTCKERATKLKWDLSAWPRPYHTRAESCWPRGGMRTCVQPRGSRLPDDPCLAPFPRHTAHKSTFGRYRNDAQRLRVVKEGGIRVQLLCLHTP